MDYDCECANECALCSQLIWGVYDHLLSPEQAEAIDAYNEAVSAGEDNSGAAYQQMIKVGLPQWGANGVAGVTEINEIVFGLPNDNPTAQDIFEHVARHLFRQGEQAQVDGACKYRSRADDGRMTACAVGCLIPNAEYRPDIERNGVTALYSSARCPPSLEKLGDHLRLLYYLQAAHDHPVVWQSTMQMRSQLRLVIKVIEPYVKLNGEFLNDLSFDGR